MPLTRCWTCGLHDDDRHRPADRHPFTPPPTLPSLEELRGISERHDAVRRPSLAAAVVTAERVYDAFPADSDLRTHVTRADAVVAVLEEAFACWENERDVYDREPGWNQVAELLARRLDEQAASLMFARVPAAVRAAAFAQVVADLRGPGDDVLED